MDLAEQFHRDGWVVVRGVVPRDEVAAMAATFATLIPDSPHYPSGLFEITGAAQSHAPLAAIARDPRFGELAARALGALRIQHLQDSLLYKCAAGAGVVEWHRDHTYVGFLVPARVVALRIALTHDTEASGCMRVVDGSHAWRSIDSVRALTESSVASLVPSLSPDERAALDAARPLELEPGDISIHHCLTVHGSGPNRSPGARRTIILRMFDADCRLDRTRLPPGGDAYFPCDAEQRLATERFPIVWEGATVDGEP